MAKSRGKKINEDPEGPWKAEHHDDHQFRMIIKVDSHQLNSDFTEASRYRTITPCIWAASANQWADNAQQMESHCVRLRSLRVIHTMFCLVTSSYEVSCTILYVYETRCEKEKLLR